MSPLTPFIAKLIGAVMISVASVLATRAAEMANIAKRMIADLGAVMLARTLFGWALYFSGLLLLFATPDVLDSASTAIRFLAPNSTTRAWKAAWSALFVFSPLPFESAP